ncbi:MAG: glycosyltransferase family 4 protein, partial [Actinobacteria bacterium]|nr:glycosyltransferase family 4 protein [Actinomycetota bacterium]
GLAGLLSAWRHVPGQLLVAGDGPQADELRRIAPPGVRFLGRLGPEEVPALVRGARALVYPSVTFEGSPRGILEAYAAGVPVVASRIGSLPEHVEEGRSGLLVPPEDPQGWARAVARLEDDAESVRMGRAAHALWRTRYSPGPALEALVAAYRAASPASLKGVARPAEALTERATQGGSA